MKIIILGAGQVGSSAAESLVSEANDITVVDTDAARLADLQERLDLRTVTGNAVSPDILRAAGAEDADLLIAVTQSDQTNLCACRISRTLFNLPMRIARLRATDVMAYPELLNDDNFAVDYAISPEQVVTDYIVKLIEFPGSLQVLEFAGGLVSLVAVRAVEGGLLIGRPLKEIRKHLPKVDARIAAIYRKDSPVTPTADTVIKPDDEVFFLAATRDIRQVMSELRRTDKPVKRVMIAGGGNIGFRVAKALEARYQVKVIETNQARSEWLAEHLSESLVLRGDSTDEKLLEGENIDEMDVFLALTNDDENNIMSSLLAKRRGAGRVMALINRRSYVDLLQAGAIDVALSPALISIGTLLRRVRRGDVAAVHTCRRGAAEALELVAHGDRKSSQVVGRRIRDLPMIEGAHIACIVRRQSPGSGRQHGEPPPADSQVIIPRADTVIEADDHVIVFLVSKRLIPRVEKLFQVGPGYL
ncbi:MAG TPA: Trk system potassium transporter TrkA [Usitatibacter sp.]|nr:Trk system potassium transporter TrkA [Usitatibacter sp.]